jgi:RNA polymerase sigma-70 factor (ECF subfamily)
MDENNRLAAVFEDNREHLRRVAYRILGSLSEADDAVQEAWLRLERAETAQINNLTGWLTTVVARLSLDRLRSRRTTALAKEQEREPGDGVDPEEELMMADSVGLALLVVLNTLTPAERLAFVLHDLFDRPFDEIAVIIGQSPTAARQLASRARRRVTGAEPAASHERPRQREIVGAFLAATRSGDMRALLEVLDPNVILRTDTSPSGKPLEVRGATKVAKLSAKGDPRAARLALIDGEVGIIVAPGGRLWAALRITIAADKIVAIEAVSERARLENVTLNVLPDSQAVGRSGGCR